MPKFGQVWFGGGPFGDHDLVFCPFDKSIRRIPLGFGVRKRFGTSVIFRIRRGNGYAGAIQGKKYQDKYKYFVPSSINNAQSEPYRVQLRAAVDYWKAILTPTEQKEYNVRADKIKGLSGYNLFIREAMKGEIDMYVDRGDPAAADFTVANFTDDATWRDLDLSAIVPASARAILLEIDFKSVSAGKEIRFRKYGQSNAINHWDAEAALGNIHQSAMAIVAIDQNRKIEYNIDNAVWTQLDFTVRGWWT